MKRITGYRIVHMDALKKIEEERETREWEHKETVDKLRNSCESTKNLLRIALIHKEQKERTIDAKNQEIRKQRDQYNNYCNMREADFKKLSEDVEETAIKIKMKDKEIFMRRHKIKQLHDIIRKRELKIEKITGQDLVKNEQQKNIDLRNALAWQKRKTYNLERRLKCAKECIAGMAGLTKGN